MFGFSVYFVIGYISVGGSLSGGNNFNHIPIKISQHAI